MRKNPRKKDARAAWHGLCATILLALALIPLSGKTAERAAGGVGRTVEPGPTGWTVRRPVMAAACPHACPFGELGDFVHLALKPLGYDVILCGNCNGAGGPRIVSLAARAPPLTALDLTLGTDTRIDAPIDFGVTMIGVLNSAYLGSGAYAKDGPHKNLRLIARIEDPVYLLVAVREGSGLTDLSQIRERRLPVRILASGGLSREVLAYYGLTPEMLAAQGGSIAPAMGASSDARFDSLISDLASPANNWESNFWTGFSQSHDLKFLELPAALLDRLACHPGVERVTAKWGLLRGIDQEILTVGQSGEAVFAREDTPDRAAYDLARAIDARRAALKWYVRPYSYDPDTVWNGLSVPLHPGAARWYREQGYIKP